MQDVLSQQEIDSLLEALNSGTLDLEETQKAELEAVVKSYDFRRPNKFSKEHLQTLEMLYQHFARMLSNFLSGYLRADINIEVASVGQIIYDEFIRSLPSPTVLTVFSPKPLPGSALMETNLQFVLPVVDLLFGGSGQSLEMDRELTDIELAVLRKLNQKILDNMASTWKDIYEISPEVQHIETNPRMQQLYSANEVVALVTLTAAINEETKGMINICLPFMVLEPVLSLLSVRQQFQVRQDRGYSEREKKLVKYWLGEVELDLEVNLGETDITVEEFLQLQVGDVLVLERKIDQDLVLKVEGLPKFGVQAGTLESHKAVQVVSLKEGESNDG